jgi:nitrite reductase/ring-hydroxylating ferredoxin subunit
MSRRGALAAIGAWIAGCWTLATAAVAGVFVAAPLFERAPRRRVSIGMLSTFDQSFRAIDIQYQTNDGWHSRQELVRAYVRLDESGTPVALSGTCTHLGCTVRWNAEANEFQCPCHGGRFAPDGRVMDGPPPRPLQRMPIEVRDGNVQVEVG